MTRPDAPASPIMIVVMIGPILFIGIGPINVGPILVATKFCHKTICLI